MIDPRKAASSSSTCSTEFVDPRPRCAWTARCPRCLPRAGARPGARVGDARDPRRARVRSRRLGRGSRTAPHARGRASPSRACASPRTLEEYAPLSPQPGDRVIVKPVSRRSSARSRPDSAPAGRGHRGAIGTTTPNCIRTTCYDALSLDYNVVLLEDCTSSRTPEVQAANIEDMEHIGAHVMRCDEFCVQGLANVADTVAEARAACENGTVL